MVYLSRKCCVQRGTAWTVSIFAEKSNKFLKIMNFTWDDFVINIFILFSFAGLFNQVSSFLFFLLQVECVKEMLVYLNPLHQDRNSPKWTPHIYFLKLMVEKMWRYEWKIYFVEYNFFFSCMVDKADDFTFSYLFNCSSCIKLYWKTKKYNRLSYRPSYSLIVQINSEKQSVHSKVKGNLTNKFKK